MSHAILLARTVGSWADYELGSGVGISVDCTNGLAAVLVQASRIGRADCDTTVLGAVLVVTELSVGAADRSFLQRSVGKTAALEVTLGFVVEVLEAFRGRKGSLAAWAVGVLLASLRLESEALTSWDSHTATSTNDTEDASVADASSSSLDSGARSLAWAVGAWRSNHVDDLSTRGETVAVELDSLAAVFVETARVGNGDRDTTVVAVIGVAELSVRSGLDGASDDGQQGHEKKSEPKHCCSSC